MWIELGYKVFVIGIYIVIVNIEELIEGVVYNGIVVVGYRVFFVKQLDGMFYGFIIEEQIVVYQVVLDGIVILYLMVVFDVVDKEFMGSKVYGVCFYFLDVVQFFVIVFE